MNSLKLIMIIIIKQVFRSVLHSVPRYRYSPKSIILSQSSELVHVGVFSVQLSRLLLFEIASNFLRRKMVIGVLKYTQILEVLFCLCAFRAIL